MKGVLKQKVKRAGASEGNEISSLLERQRVNIVNGAAPPNKKRVKTITRVAELTSKNLANLVSSRSLKESGALYNSQVKKYLVDAKSTSQSKILKRLLKK